MQKICQTMAHFLYVLVDKTLSTRRKREMAKIVMIDDQNVMVELKSGKRKVFPLDAVNYEDPRADDEVVLYKDEDGSIYIDLPEDEVENTKPTEAKSKNKKEKKEGRSALGIAGFVIGIVALIFSFIPIINNIAFFIGILAVVFGIIGCIIHKSKGMAIAGIVMGILAMVITLLLQSIWSKAFDEASEQLNDVIESADSQLDNMTGDNTEELLNKSISVEFGDFSIYKDEYGFIKSSLPVTITNLETENKTFSIHLEAIDGSGARIIDDTIYANDLGAGQSQILEAFQYIQDEKFDVMQNVTFNVVEVSMY